MSNSVNPNDIDVKFLDNIEKQNEKKSLKEEVVNAEPIEPTVILSQVEPLMSTSFFTLNNVTKNNSTKDQVGDNKKKK